MSASHEEDVTTMSEEPTRFATEDDLYSFLATDTTATITLPNGKSVEVRGLTRAEHLWMGKGDADAAEIEARMLSKAMIRPALNLTAAKRFQDKAPSSVVAAITAKIRDLSGFGEGAQKSAV